MSTEGRLARVRDAETWPTEEGLAAMLDHQGLALFAVRQALPALAAAVTAAAARLERGQQPGKDARQDASLEHHPAERGQQPGKDARQDASHVGRLVYAGAGASGRLAVQDGVELHPTFGWPHERLAVLVAGGDAALTRSVEGAEDDAASGTAAAAALGLTPADVVLAVAASGGTPYTCAVLTAARRDGALTVGFANNAGSPLLQAAEHPVLLATGPEFLPGSTRLTAGTAQKIALNLFSTRLMTELGRVYRGLMVDVVASNAKLVARAQGIVAELSGVAPETAAHAYEAADGDIKLAVLMLDGMGRTAAQARLDACGGDLRRARSVRAPHG